MNHSQAERLIIQTTRAFLLASGDRDKAIDLLIEEGIAGVAAALYSDLIPMAFGWALLKEIGVQKFPIEIELQDEGTKVKVTNSHLFTAALNLAWDIFQNGYTEIFSKRVVEMLVSHSAEVVAMNKALNSDPKLNVAEVELTSSLFGYSSKEFAQHA